MVKNWDNFILVIKNNRPIAVVMSISEYKSNLESLKRTEAILEKLEELKLLKAANEHEDDNSSDFAEFITEPGYSYEALERLAENIDIE